MRTPGTRASSLPQAGQLSVLEPVALRQAGQFMAPVVEEYVEHIVPPRPPPSPPRPPVDSAKRLPYRGPHRTRYPTRRTSQEPRMKLGALLVLWVVILPGGRPAAAQEPSSTTEKPRPTPTPVPGFQEVVVVTP